jgi:hypothetical protein
MTREKRIEVFILVREKMEEIADIIKDNNAGPEFMATYCFGLSCDEGQNDGPESYEFLAGYSVDGGEELNIMFNVMAHSFAAEQDDDDDDEPTNSIEYWLKK